MRLFLAYPFTLLIDKMTGLLKQDEIQFIQTTISILEREGYSVFSAQNREKYGGALMDPDTATKLDHEEMKKADLVVAFPGYSPVSGGVHVELGWASAFGKPIIMFLHKNQEYTPMLTGLSTVTYVNYIVYDDTTPLKDLILQEVSNFNNKQKSFLAIPGG